MDILIEDFEYIRCKALPWEELRGKNIFITGGSGLIGSLLIRYMDYLNSNWNYNINLIALVRSKQKANRVLKGCQVKIMVGDICELPSIEEDIDYIFHCAAVTKSKEMIEHPIMVSEGIVNGTQSILNLALKNSVKGMVYLSSLEVYGNTNVELVDEEVLGFIEILNTRSCYPLGKRMAENICYSYYRQYGVPVKIARLAQTFGAGILDDENRIFAQLAKCVISKEDIILHTTGETEGNYCYLADAIYGIFTLLLKGEDGQAYNITNEETSISVREMAEMVTQKYANGEIKVIFDIPKENKYGYAAVSKFKLSSKKIQKLGWKPSFNLEEAYGRMICWMKQ